MITELAPVLEALLLASDKPLSVERLGQVFDEHDGVDNKRIKKALRELQKSYDGRGYQLVEVASGFRFQVQQGYALWVARLWQEKPQKYSKALLETLSIIAYQQPITRGEIESIRGVGVSSSIIHTMIDRSWIRSVGHKEVPGRPELFATTKEFLDHFNLKQLSDLPALDELASWNEATMAPAKLKQPQQQEIDVVTESIH
jgi:segregation and condensation protein B|tara:strand:- start:25 stop:627 length:603 start_codon:yes stop_codon:yes gene_type:complete